MLLPLNPMLNDMQLVGLKGSVEGFSSTTDKVSWTLIVVGHGMPVFANEGIAATFNEIRDTAWSLMKDPSFHFYIAC
ncbi:hypothetical protein Gotur_018516 [Gossypium turneri]